MPTRPNSTDTRPRAAFGLCPIQVLILLLLGLSAWPALLVAQEADAEQSEEAEDSEEELDSLVEVLDPAALPAKAAFVLLVDNQKRVLDSSPSVTTMRMMTQPGERTTTADSARAAIQAKASLRITAGLIDDSRGFEAEPHLRRMQSSQSRLLEIFQSQSGLGHAAGISDDANGMMLVFAEAERQALGYIDLSPQERHAILLEYRDRIVQADKLAEDAGVDAFHLDVDDDGRPISRAEYNRKKEKYDQWLAEKEEQERELKRRRAARAERQQERYGSGGKTEAPSVGLKEQAFKKEPEKPDPRVQEKMELWHIRWTNKAEPLKAALGNFLKLDLKRQNTKSINVCQQLYKAVVAISTDKNIMAVPDAKIQTDLGTAVAELQEMSYTCTYGKFDQTREHKAAGQKALGQAVQRLKLYQLNF